MRLAMACGVLAICLGLPGLVQAQDSPSDQGIWFRADALAWWVKNAPLPVLLTTDPTNGNTATAGGLGDPSTQVLIGSSGANFGVNPGARFTLGGWLTPCVGLEGGGFFLTRQHQTFAANSDSTGNPFLFRPFLNLDTGNVNAGGFVSLPGLVAGAFQASASTQLWGADVHAVFRGLETENLRISWLAGFRYLDLQEGLDLADARNLLTPGGSFGGAPTAPGDHLVLLDSFHTRSQFYGGQFGMRGEAEFGRLTIGGDVRVALGATRQSVDVAGASTLIPAAGAGTTLPGGLLALSGNSGNRANTDFSVVPELYLNAGYQVTNWMRISVGYDLVYWTRVVRPGDQVPLALSASQVPTSPSFAGANAVAGPTMNSSDFWAQGIHLALTFRY